MAEVVLKEMFYDYELHRHLLLSKIVLTLLLIVNFDPIAVKS